MKVNKKILILLLFFFKLQADSTKIVFEKFTYANKIAGLSITYIYQDSYGFVWFGTEKGIYRYDGYHFKHFKHNPKDTTSISDDKCAYIMEDSRKRLWIGTFNGLNLFNRKQGKFKRFFHDSLDSESLSNSVINQIYEDNEGVIWVATLNGLNQYIPEENHFKLFPLDYDSTKNSEITYIFEDSNNNLWIGVIYFTSKNGFTYKYSNNDFSTNDGILFKLDKNRNIVQRYQYDANNPHSFNGDAIVYMAEDQTNTLWIITFLNGVLKLDQKKQAFHQIDLKKGKIFCAYMEDSKYLWLGLWTNNGAARFNVQEEKLTYLDQMDQNSAGFLFSIMKDNSGTLWASKMMGKIVRHNTQKISFKVNEKIKVKNKNIFITSISEDSNNELWLGTREGLFQYNKKTNTVKRYTAKTPRYDQNILSAINNLRQDKNRLLFSINCVGNNQNIEKSFHLSKKTLLLIKAMGECTDGQFYDYASIEQDSTVIWRMDSTKFLHAGGSIKNKVQIDLLVLKPGQYKLKYKSDDSHCYNSWNARPPETPEDWGIQLYKITKNEGKLWINRLKKNLNNIRKNKSISDNMIYSLLRDKKDVLWIGTQNGLDWYDPKTRLFSTILKKYDNPYYNQNSRIWCLAQSKSGEIWMSSTFAFLKYDLLKNKLTNLTQDLMKPGTLGDPWLGIWSMAFYSDSILFLGTSTKKLSKYFINYNKLKQINLNSVIPTLTSNATIFTIYIDSNENVYFGTGDGLIFYKKSNNRYYHFTQSDGLNDNYIIGIVEDDYGFIWISTLYGISKFLPKDQLFISYGANESYLDKTEFLFSPSANLLFQSADGTIYCGGPKLVSFHPKVSPEKVKPVIISSLSVISDSTNLPVDVAFMDRITLYHNQNFFTLEFSLPDYVDITKNQYKYILEGFDKDWIFSGTRHSANYTNVPPGEYLFKVKGLNSNGFWSEKDKELKIIILPPWYATWWFRSLALIFIITLLYYAYSRRVRYLQKERKKQQDFSRQLIQSQEAERKRIASGLHDSLGQNLLIVNNEIQLLVLEDEQMEEKVKPILSGVRESINEVREISYNLHPHLLDRLGLNKALESVINKVSKSSGIKIEYELNEVEGFLDKEKQIHFYRIIQEALNNIVKHARATEVKILIVKQRKNVVATVSDNGRGFNVRAVMSRSNAKVGFGLANMRERARLIGGRLRIVSSPGKETEIILRIPIYTGG